MLYGQESSINERLSQFYFEHNEAPRTNDFDRIEKLVLQLEKKRSRNTDDLSFLKTLFYKTHSKILKDYSSMASVNETIEDGTYGCLTGTLIYALLLDHFDFEYDIVELPNHVFLKVKLANEEVFFESTLAHEGFIRNGDFFKFQQSPTPQNVNWLQVISEPSNGLIKNNPFNIISLKELSALHHFNESVKLYKNKAFQESILHAVEAYHLYPTEKNEMLMRLVLNRILANHDLDKGFKKDLVARFEKLQASQD